MPTDVLPYSFALAEYDKDEPLDIPWEDLWHVYVFANDKGGSGKTSVTANFALMLMRYLKKNGQDPRILALDINGQGNLAIHEFGVDKKYLDEGEALVEALRKGTPLQPVPVRPGLDLIVGGPKIEEFVTDVYPRLRSKFTKNADLRLLQCLLPIAGDYDFILIDLPPENPVMQRQGLACGRWVVMSTKTDRGSLDGTKTIKKHFDEARRVNPLLTMLGVILFATGRNSTQIHKKASDYLRGILKAGYHRFERVIGHSELVASLSRDDEHPLVELFDQYTGGAKLPDTIQSVYDDYETLCRQILQRTQEVRQIMERPIEEEAEAR
ncbi:ParA family protein [Actinacidiphila sp. ITFR-21]|uniref:ParA family protein n=1 Tax=Actinacidiphila sp. ITFR-21 TaxID=3075199 RepID=UPI0028893D12|nr:ParA family protein [Streptomyces sp. ITFR-21]WNI20056.1 ParA family protein [Streptomyces sp. ITFR-21]